ncbi:FecR family protein [Chitinophaga sancti]|uniref:FecR domain-containing protein n=1 Tax=Chitinophaga sancti TaxID=1004 RepID=A0A1K1SKL4_9BACT|nr:FecR family protein [Chitinophaga sancti]WQD65470.1 FecR domain-containing protein [Chitinophaga sancti]WQG88907.1 FecR domain-containing protein [Chitinophaga sancti]SFW84891.1 FecR family protein [Chitinophaga sancti]
MLFFVSGVYLFVTGANRAIIKMENIHIEELFKKYLLGTITEEELRYLNDFFQRPDNLEEQDALFIDHFSKDFIGSSPLDAKAAIVKDAAWQEIQQRLGITATKHKYKRLSWWKGAAAAAGLLLVLSSGFYLYREYTGNRTAATRFADVDIPPGTNRATLTTSNGTVFQLNGAKEEIVIDKESIRYKDGDILPVKDGVRLVTLSTPRGGQYRVTLSDGTRVWLNAASSLSYPTTFNGKDREVTLHGEAYFEVAQQASQPFIVHTPKQDIKVLGTEFNINCYQDEGQTLTTLVTGSVRVEGRGGEKPLQLHPGEQAVLDNEDFTVSMVDVSLYTAWKDGDFRFRATPLVEVLHQIERWYDLDVDYTGIPEDIKIHASIRRDKKLSTVLHALEKIGDIKFEVKDRNIRLVH